MRTKPSILELTGKNVTAWKELKSTYSEASLQKGKFSTIEHHSLASVIQKTTLKGNRASGVSWWSKPQRRDTFPLPPGVWVQTSWQVCCTGRPPGGTLAAVWAEGRCPAAGRALTTEAYPVSQPSANVREPVESCVVAAKCYLVCVSEKPRGEPEHGGAVAHTQVPWWVGGGALRLFKDWDLSLKSDGFCCETSTRALATISPEEARKWWPFVPCELPHHPFPNTGNKLRYASVMMRKMQNCHSLGVWPDCPGGGKPEGPEGRRNRTVNTAAFPPEHGSMATGLGAPF